MDIAVLLLSMCFFFAIGMPIAYALALSSLVGALWIDLPVGAVMQQFASGVGKVSMLTIPFFHAHAGRTLAGQYPRNHDHERHFRIVGRRHVRNRFGDDSPDGRERLSAGIRHQRHNQRVVTGDHHTAEP